MLRTVVLHGDLRDRWGGPFAFDIDTAAEAGRALACQLAGFAEHIWTRSYRVVRGDPDRGLDLEVDWLHRPILGSCAELHIIPAVEGAGGRRGGVGKIILGAAIVVAAVAAAFVFAPAGAGIGAALGGTAFSALGFNISFGQLALFGAGLLLQGISMEMAPTPQQPNYAVREPSVASNDLSFIFNGPVNMSEQGHPIPLCFGRILAGSIVISGGIQTYMVAPQGGGFVSGSTVGTGGGGCFAGGTAIAVPDGGDRPIQDIAVGNEVLAPREDGGLCRAVVEETWAHPPEPVWRFRVAETVLSATPNHWAILPSGAGAELGTLLPGRDRLVDRHGAPVPLLGVEPDGDRPVFNLRTSAGGYLAAGIRVFDGGRGRGDLGEIRTFASGAGFGGGGGKGGGK